MSGTPGQDPAAQFGIIVKRELVVGPSFAGEQFVGSALASRAPADALQGSQPRRPLVAGQLLTQHLEGHVESERGHLGVLDPVRNYFDGQSLGVADGFFAGFAVGHDAREFQRFGDPAPIVLPVQFDGEVHIVIVRQAVALECSSKPAPTRLPRQVRQTTQRTETQLLAAPG